MLAPRKRINNGRGFVNRSSTELNGRQGYIDKTNTKIASAVKASLIDLMFKSHQGGSPQREMSKETLMSD